MNARLPHITPEQLDADQLSLYSELTQGERATGQFRLVESDGSLTGPFGAMVLVPSVGRALSRLGTAVRYGTHLSARLREIVILAVAAHRNSAFEWYAHTLVGRSVGFTDLDFYSLQRAEPEHWTNPKDRLAHQLTIAVLTSRQLSDDLFDRASETLGITAIVEILTTIGYYEALELLLSVLKIGLPKGE